MMSVSRFETAGQQGATTRHPSPARGVDGAEKMPLWAADAGLRSIPHVERFDPVAGRPTPSEFGILQGAGTGRGTTPT